MLRTRRVLITICSLCSFLVMGCQPDIQLPVKELGLLKTSPTIKGRDGGFSGIFQGRSVWLFGDTILNKPGADGSSWRNNTWSWTTDLSTKDGITGFLETNDSAGAPKELFVQTKAEADFNEAHKGDPCKVKPCGARWALWPGPILEVKAQQAAVVFYGKIYGEPGEWNFHAVGHSAALWKEPTQPVERPVLRPNTPHPTLLFAKEEPNFGMSGAVSQGGKIYAFGCEGGLTKPCRLGRVPVGEVLKRDAWEYWTGDDTWSRDIKQVKSVFDGAPMMTVQWNPYLERYLAIYSKPLEARVVLRTAKKLTGPWSAENSAFVGVLSHDGAVPYGALGHAEYAREGGRYELITYFRSPAAWAGEIRVVELDLAPLKASLPSK